MYVCVSIYSYNSVTNAFGWVPGNDSILEMERETGHTIETFPPNWGLILIYFYICSALLIPCTIGAHYILFRTTSSIMFDWKPGVALAGIWCAVFALMQFSEPVSWYFQFVLD